MEDHNVLNYEHIVERRCLSWPRRVLPGLVVGLATGVSWLGIGEMIDGVLGNFTGWFIAPVLALAGISGIYSLCHKVGAAARPCGVLLCFPSLASSSSTPHSSRSSCSQALFDAEPLRAQTMHKLVAPRNGLECQSEPKPHAQERSGRFKDVGRSGKPDTAKGNPRRGTKDIVTRYLDGNSAASTIFISLPQPR